MPSTFTVTNLLDSGAGSLRAAVNAAGNGDTIDFAPALHGTIALTGGQLPISSSVTIAGPGAHKLAVSGTDTSRIFDISGSAGARISGLTLTDGLASIGGAILLEGNASLNLSNCTVSDNAAIGSDNPSIDTNGGFGGGIEDTSSGTLTVTGSRFDGNRAIGVGPNNPLTAGYVLSFGGGIDVAYAATGSSTISNSTFTNNQVLGGSAGASSGGGGISNSSSFASMTVTDCTVSDNAAVGAAGGDGIVNFGSGQGGGMNNFGSLTVVDSTVSNNLALGTPLAPGAVPSQTVSTGSGVAGGGIFCLSVLAPASVTVIDSTLRGNQAIGGAGAPGSAGSVAEGGGISIIVSTGMVSGCTIDGNVAQGGAGGAGGIGAPGASGGIDLVFSTVTVSNTRIVGNAAIGGAGGAGAAGGNGVGGGINAGTGVLVGFGDDSSLTLTNCTLANNQAIGGAGGASSNGGDGLGGGLAILASSANVTACNIDANSAVGGAAGAGGSAGQGVGGGVYNLGTFGDAFTVIKGNHASTSNDDVFP